MIHARVLNHFLPDGVADVLRGPDQPADNHGFVSPTLDCCCEGCHVVSGNVVAPAFHLSYRAVLLKERRQLFRALALGFTICRRYRSDETIDICHHLFSVMVMYVAWARLAVSVLGKPNSLRRVSMLA